MWWIIFAGFVVLIILVVALLAPKFPPDPVYNCPYHKKHGCSHVDGLLCDMNNCNILDEFLDSEDSLDK